MSSVQLLSKRRFLPLFITQFLGALNDNIFKNALVIWITYHTTSVFGLPPAQAVVLCGGLFILPFFIFSATSGQLADAYDKSRLMQIIKLTEIFIMLLGAIGFYTHQIGFLIAVLFLMGTHSTFFGPLKYSILPQHLHEEELVGGNAMIESGTFLAILIGTLIGGIFVARGESGPHIVAWITIFVAIAGFMSSRSIPEARPGAAGLRIQWDPIPPTIQILRTARSQRSVFLSILGISWFWFFGAALLSLFPSYCKDLLHARESVVTLFLTMFSVGIGIGAFLCEKISGKRLELGLVPFGSIGISIFTLDLFCVGTPTSLIASAHGALLEPSHFLHCFQGLRILADLLLLSIFSGFFTIPLYTLIQERSENSHRSRIIAANNILNALFMVVSAIGLGALLAAHFTIPALYLILALLNAGVAIYIYTLLPEFFIRFILWILAHLIYRVRAKGLEHIPQKGAAILVSNHVTFIDWLIVAACVQRPVRFVMDHGLAKGWLVKWVLNETKVILIAPAKENPVLLQQAFEKIEEELRAGELVCVFPEGRLTLDGEMSDFRSGIEKMIERVPVPVVPMALRGLWGSFFTKANALALKKLPGKLWRPVELAVSAPVPPEQAKAKKLHEIVLRLRGDRR